jgi:hypothetical protein
VDIDRVRDILQNTGDTREATNYLKHVHTSNPGLAVSRLTKTFLDSGAIHLPNTRSSVLGRQLESGAEERNVGGESIGESGSRVPLPAANTPTTTPTHIPAPTIVHAPSSNKDAHNTPITPAQLLDEQEESGLHIHTSTPFQHETYIQEAIAFAISTPGDPSGQFYDICMKKPGYEDWVTRHVTLEEAIRAGRISSRWAAQRMRQWGQDSPIYLNRVLGEFADSSEGGVIPLSWVIRANDRWIEYRDKGWAILNPLSNRVLGVDVAHMGEDKTVLAQRHALVIRNIHVFSKLPLPSVAGYVKVIGQGHIINIEVDGGYGASVYEMLIEDNVPLLRPITVGGGTFMRDRSGELGFRDVRSAMWWNLRELLDPDNGVDIALPPIEQLQADLVAPNWQMMRGGIVALEEKKYTKMRLGRSTDYGDAVCLAFWTASSGGGVVF